MFPLDHLDGDFTEFPTELRRDGDFWVASAMGIEVRHRDQAQALNDLNAKVYDEVSKGNIVPNMGN